MPIIMYILCIAIPCTPSRYFAELTQCMVQMHAGYTSHIVNSASFSAFLHSQSKLVGHYATSQLCLDSPAPHEQHILGMQSSTH